MLYYLGASFFSIKRKTAKDDTFEVSTPLLKLNSTKKISRNHSKGLKRKEVRQVVIISSVPSIMIAKHFTTAGTILMNCCMMNQIKLRKVYDRSDWHVFSTFEPHKQSNVLSRRLPLIQTKVKKFQSN